MTHITSKCVNKIFEETLEDLQATTDEVIFWLSNLDANIGVTLDFGFNNYIQLLFNLLSLIYYIVFTYYLV